MIKSVGIDFASADERKARCLDERTEPRDGFDFDTSPEGLAKLEARIFKNGPNPIVVFEPTGLAWVRYSRFLETAK